MFPRFSPLLLLPFLLIGEAIAAPPNEKAITFTAQDGSSVEAFEGTFEVPENRADPDSRTLTLGYVRFPATTETPGAPIVYLAGGPGGSGTGTAKGRRFPLFMALREQADVIAFDQRGTGLSDQFPGCISDTPEPVTAISDEAYIALTRTAFAECLAFWEDEGIDISGYNTIESARDIDALRSHLGTEKVRLWGISYGTHLALAAMKEMPERIDRAILASVEGLDQTVKMPARTDAYYARLQTAVLSQDKAADAMPDIAGMMRRVLARLEDEPVTLSIPLESGSQEIIWTRRDMQRVNAGLVADPGSAAYLLGIYLAADQGDFSPLEGALARYRRPQEMMSFNGMSSGMDVASGIGAARLAAFEGQAKSALNGQWHNFPMPQLATAAPDLDLGDEFRQAPANAIPTLVFSGTLDGRTFPESQREAVAGLSNAHIVTVVNAGHNLFMVSPEVGEVMARFLDGEEITTEEITVPLPDFLPY
ncbi:alpha/beta fold hydrolase [Parvularcula marina]|uniref:alpha/beta fold hydrolase n=1 Tax=Parvularcula marina TaxID=2292771 RepID=UPI003519CE60